MLAFFRRALSSWIVLGLLAFLMVAFVLTGVDTPFGGAGGALSGGNVAEVGGEGISPAEVTRRAQNQLQAARQENPGLDMGAFAREGGIDRTIEQIVASRAMEIWARKHGFGASKRLVDGEIASAAAFRGPTGQFDRAMFDAVLQRERITEAVLRQDLTGELLRRQILVPVSGATRVPVGVVTPYAALLLESRAGMIGVVPASAMIGGTPPTDPEVDAYYRKNLARYTLPERRVLRFALFGREKLTASVKPSEAEIAAFYKANAATYGAKETRSFSQVVLPDEAAAKAFATKVRNGTPFATAAREAGFAPADTAIGQRSREELAKLASPTVATAAFAVPAGAIADPAKSELGWHVVKVDTVSTAAARPLDQARFEIAAALEKQKADEALANMVASIDDAIGDGSTFDDVARSEKLEVVTTPAVLASGIAPDMPTWQAPPELGVLLRTAFEAEADDDPTVETIGTGQRYALLDVAEVLPSAPQPLAKVRAQVIEDLLAQRASDRAKALATAIQAKVKSGVPIDRAFAESDVRLPAPQRASGRQLELSRPGAPVPPPLRLMFSMKQGDTKLIAAPNGQGWFVVTLQQITRGDPAKAPGLIEATRGEFARVVGEEYVAQFVAAVQKEVGVNRDRAAIERLKRELAGGR